ncbi:MAG: cation transporter, partial [Phycisphaerae bacterium]|nr:cation transporter [Phycisphaerae bacterium]
MPSGLRPSIHWLLGFIPIAVVLDRMQGIPPPVLFFCAALAIVPIARLIIQGTEQIALRTGDAIGGLLNATFGNAPELIISVVALRAGYFDMVRASLIGAVLANLLLALGVSFLVGGIRHHDQKFNAGAARAYSTMMLLATVSLAVPSAFSRFLAPDATLPQETSLNIGIACVLLLTYFLYLVFCIKTHPREFASEHAAEPEHDGPRWSPARAVAVLLGASVLAAWMSEILVGAAEGTGKSLG